MREDRVLMNPGPRFEEICALFLFQCQTKQIPKILFRDTHGDPGSTIPDIDVRAPYPPGSSAFEQMAIQLGCEEQYADLIQVFNEDNRTGYLNRKPFRDSFIWLIPRLFDLEPEDAGAKISYRRYLVAAATEIAAVAFWAYGYPPLSEFLRGLNRPRAGGLRNWPQRQNFVRNWPELANAYPSPMTLAGYAYLRFLREEKVEVINSGLSHWRGEIAKVQAEYQRTAERWKGQNPSLFRWRDIWAAYLKVENNFDIRAFFSTYPSVQVVVAYDRREQVPQAVIQVRHGIDLCALMDRLYEKLKQAEPDCWHLDRRAIPGPTGSLLNGGRNRFCERGSQIAADPQKIFALMNECM